MNRIKAMAWLPVFAAALAGLVYIWIDCQQGTGCGNVTAVTVHKSAFQEFMSLWSVG